MTFSLRWLGNAETGLFLQRFDMLLLCYAMLFPRFSHGNIIPSWRRLLRPRLGPEAVAAGGPGCGGTVAGGRHQVLSAEELVPEVALQTHLVDVGGSSWKKRPKDRNSILEFEILSSDLVKLWSDVVD